MTNTPIFTAKKGKRKSTSSFEKKLLKDIQVPDVFKDVIAYQDENKNLFPSELEIWEGMLERSFPLLMTSSTQNGIKVTKTHYDKKKERLCINKEEIYVKYN